MKRLLSIIALSLALALSPLYAQKKNPLKNTDRDFFKTEEAARIGNQLLIWQRNTGAWPKNVDMASPMDSALVAKVLSDKDRLDDSTIDNGATCMQMRFLARLYREQPQKKYREAFRKGLEFLLEAQYDNGGWPQFYPKPRSNYAYRITYNDDAMENVMRLLRDVSESRKPYESDITDSDMRKRLAEAFSKGVGCILKTQIKNADGTLTVWCQQHDENTFLPAKARAYELPSYCSAESAGLVDLLLEIPNPSDSVKNAIHSAMKWFDTYKITGVDVDEIDGDRTLVVRPSAGPIWARYYDLKDCEPFVCDRDGIPRKGLSEIGSERRNGYRWFVSEPLALYEKYARWIDKWDPDVQDIDIDPYAKGANENGTFTLHF